MYVMQIGVNYANILLTHIVVFIYFYIMHYWNVTNSNPYKIKYIQLVSLNLKRFVFILNIFHIYLKVNLPYDEVMKQYARYICVFDISICYSCRIKVSKLYDTLIIHLVVLLIIITTIFIFECIFISMYQLQLKHKKTDFILSKIT